jgi:hypothetical protein
MASLYTVSSTSRNTLYAGDRTGSHYFLIMENNKATTSANATSGRYSPNFTDEVQAIMINPFVKYMGLELFGTYEMASGRTISETDKRKASQIAADLLYRFGAKEDFWLGAGYNAVTAEMPTTKAEVKIDRVSITGGWFITNSVMMKAEYVVQNYKDFPVGNIMKDGKFDGVMVEAVLGF